ncbi:WD40-repeat-containing domain protein [Microdochium trichocladiopsis]|uniref:WD40-repeat-containing domain protein n=1 Tax=Microdochium trichocladiopsis TaxID=1682393 RepID=A0A9P8XXT3_9PEZI|nr:WD40-repeat-containing domain protein [Microdochium trichocladiopsis]KAH7024544.1 WD40-repeat-containing domain protein [Microdochium trichocladiopsis]
MVSYSSYQFFQDWRYAIAKDFVTKSGDSYPYAHNGHKSWGQEDVKLPPIYAGTHDIHVLETSTWTVVSVLRAHSSEIESLALQPGTKGSVLVSSDNGRRDGSGSGKPTIIIWDVARDGEPPSDTPLGSSKIELTDNAISSIVGNTATSVAAQLSEAMGIALNEEQILELQKSFTSPIQKVVEEHSIATKRTVHGRMRHSTKSGTFSPSGGYMVYYPGDRPRSNDSAPWDMKICSLRQGSAGVEVQDHATLRGHTDCILWTGWSPDEKFFASVAWDKTIRVWDAATGELKQKFDTDGQNWTGAWSPDSRHLAATCGTGALFVYDVSDGSTVWEQHSEKEGRRMGWRRALAWHPEGKLLAVGAQELGRVVVLDTEKREPVSERQLSVEQSRTDNEDARAFLGGWIEVRQLSFVDGGRKLVVFTGADDSIEVYDSEEEQKWRFSRGGTDDNVEGHEQWRDEEGKVTTSAGSGMLVWEDKTNGLLRLASLDCDGPRLWSVPLTGV